MQKRGAVGQLGGFGWVQGRSFWKTDLLMPRQPPAKNSLSEPLSGSILQVKVRLLDISPMVGRRLLASAAFTLEELHGVFQVTMGW